MNNRQRMRASNAIMKKALVSMGFYDIFSFPHTRYSLDVWGLYDAVCKKKTEGDKFDVFWIQFKTNYASTELRQQMSDFCKNSGQKAILAEYVPMQVKYAGKRKGSKTVNRVKVSFFP